MRTRWFIYSAGVILLLTGELKILSLFGTSGFLQRIDPVFHLPFFRLFLVVGVIEMAVAICCICFSRAAYLNLTLVAWLSTNFVIYRVGLLGSGWERRCQCLGDLAEELRLSPTAAEWITLPLLLYLLLGSYTRLLLHHKREATPAAPDPLVGATTR